MIKGYFTPGFAYRNYDSTSDLPAKMLVLSNNDIVYIPVGSQIAGQHYKHIDLNNFTVIIKFQLFSKPTTFYFLDFYGNSNDIFYIRYNQGYLNALVGSSYCDIYKPSLSTGDYYTLILRGNRNVTLDGTNYLKMDLSSGESDAYDSTWNEFSSIDNTISIGQTWRNIGENCLQGKIHIHFLNRAIADSEVDSYMTQTVPIAEPETAFMLIGELTNSRPTFVDIDKLMFEPFETDYSNWNVSSGTTASLTSNALRDTKSLQISQSIGGWVYRLVDVEANTPYLIYGILKGTASSYAGIQVFGNNSGLLLDYIHQLTGNEETISKFFVTGSEDTQAEIYLFTELSTSNYYWNGYWSATTTWGNANIQWQSAN